MKTKILTVLSILVGLLFIIAGADKFFHYFPVPENLPEKTVQMGIAFNSIGWLMPLVATGEIIGGLLLLFNRTRALGVLVLFPILVGILLANASIAPQAIPMPAVMLAILLWYVYENRQKYFPLLSR